ncbi:MAG: tRNA 2-thiocytidine(32) synthetase TtcA [Coxiellaceae bacterium]|nr:tRNA 2-thiocytidine(32) synthetase TtcA [Coxiellaceae bacterium]
MSKIEKKLMHYMTKAVADYNMIQSGDRVMACLSGGKDSYTMVKLLQQMRLHRHCDFELFVYTLDQTQPGWDDSAMRQWLDAQHVPYEIETRNTYKVVKEKIPEGKTYCSLCSRLRRGNIYRYAEDNGFNKVALGHHRDDMVQTLLMSILYSGQIRSMPPKLLTDSKKQIVIRPLAYCQENDIRAYAREQAFAIIPCNLCGSQQNLVRQKVKKLLAELTENNPKVPSNILHALQSVQPSQLMDKNLWDFMSLEDDLLMLVESEQ